ncbi:MULTISPECIES: lytic transglycosylase domain-containing protein [unclassified Streptomyces]|uniref:lytic transglycosylase domain-containing protein n=1 Tax=unclassified Streptomyces TaxID=2593676 RepID=UPI002E2F2F61|nr:MULTISPECIES: lytic transglycosylase domain-containing protein [unclassified Streptomyces]WUC65190.1 lytic transglycosylase domain-containing protein [Streptomyces sp. NBC_00539]
MKPLHRHVVNTSRKVLCTAALAASLTTAAVVTNTPTAGAGESEPTPDSPQATDRGDARLDLPGLVADPPVPPGAVAPEGASGIPGTALDAYKRAAVSVAAALPHCNLPWELVAGIGRVESVHASGYGLKSDGSTEKPIRGPRLDGNGYAQIKDTDKGEWDADTEYDRAVGPLQFIPSTWKTWGADGNGDGSRDPNNIYDAALGAGLYLCAGDRDLSDPAKLDQAILSYNNSREYVNSVLGYMRQYKDGGVAEVPNPPAGNFPTPPVTAPLPTPRPPAPQPSAPKPEASKPPAQPEKPKPTAPRLAKFELVGDPELQAEAGAALTPGAKFKAVLSDGKPAAGQKVVFAVESDTTGGTVFQADKKNSAVVLTDAQGFAGVPGLTAGPKDGTFSFRASAYDADNFTVVLKGTVTAKPVANLLVRADHGTKPLEAVAGTSVNGFQLVATSQGQPVAGTKTSAGLGVQGAGGAWVPVDPAKATGPYFKGPDGKKLFTVDLAPSGADGKITLPELYTTDVAPGTYFLRVVTPEKVELVLELSITAPATPGPTPAPTAPNTPTPSAPTPTAPATKP